MKRNGVAFPEAVRIVAELAGIVLPSGTTMRSIPRPRPLTSPTTGSKSAKADSPAPERPSGLPLDEASSLVIESEKRLLRPEGRTALEYLHWRGLSDETIKTAHLGWTPGVWLPKREGDRSYAASGVVIPWLDENRLALVKIRQREGTPPEYAEAFPIEGKPKYAEGFRDRPGLYPGPAFVEAGRPLIYTEGEFDCLLLHQELHDLAAVVTLGSASSRPELRTRAEMLAASVWLIATDADVAGDKAAADWPARAIRVRPPDGMNDWTYLWKAGRNSIRYLWGRYLPMSRPWEELAALRW